MELRQLRYFAEVGRVGTFRGAANRLSVAEPALWQQVRRLERELGIALFERIGRGVRLTEAGQRLLARAEDALASSQRITELAQDLRDGRVGTVSIAVPVPAVGRFLAAAIARFRRAHPDIRIVMQEFPRADVTPRTSPVLRTPIDALLAGVVDVAIGARAESLPGMRLYDISVVALGHGRPSKRISVSRLRGEPLLVPPPGSFSRTLLEHAFHAAGLEPRIEFESPFPQTLVALSYHGLGIAVVADDAIGFEERARAAVVTSRGRALAAEHWLHWRTTSDPAVATFIEAVGKPPPPGGDRSRAGNR